MVLQTLVSLVWISSSLFILLCLVCLFFPHSRVVCWLTLSTRAHMMARRQRVSVGYARAVLHLMDRHQHGDLTHDAFLRAVTTIAWTYPEDAGMFPDHLRSDPQ